MNFNIPARRTFQATAYAMLDGVVLSVHFHSVTVYRHGDTISATFVDGQAASIERAAHLITWAKATGSLVITDRHDALAPLQEIRNSGPHFVL
ncbi:hypothetical protein [Deinococcus sp.]|uniref:hypothetical protein n=1 Tax=Deinococcus sp. TaxID=47478 RepID=UPI003CC561B2